MNLRILFLISIIFIFINIIVFQFNEEPIKGTIEKIQYSNNKLTLTLTNEKLPYIVFTNNLLNLKKNEKIKIYGKKEIYKGETQIIVSKIIKIQLPA